MPRLAVTALVVLATILAHPRRTTAQTRDSIPTPSADASAIKLAAWTQGATCYEIFVRSFFDSDGDGVGDFNGLTSKLDYINDGDSTATRDLGARCLWLMPISPSPSYHGYDVTNYYGINPEYGSVDDFKRFVSEAHRRGIRILVDMVVNHSSNEHPYFKHAALHTDSPWRDWYVWLPQDPQIKSPWGSPIWHKSPSSDEFYYGLFWHGMPDFNINSSGYNEEAKKIATFWLDSMDVDGFRLDAVKHLAEADSGRQVQNVPGTHVWLRDYAEHVRRTNPEAYTVGEVYDNVGALRPYYPNQLDSYFAFEVSDSILSGVRTGIGKGMLQPILRLQSTIPGHRWSPFLRNHDQSRTLTVLEGDVAKAKVAMTIMLAMPGLPFVYYGEELGMTADKPDPRLRTPMHWTREPAAGFTKGVPWEPLQPDSLTANVEAQDGDSTSLLNLTRRLIHLRAANPALATGELIPLAASNESVVAFVRRLGNRAVILVANVGANPAERVTVISPDNALPSGRFTPGNLLGGSPAAQLRIGRNGRIGGWVPLPSLAPKQAYLFEVGAPAATRPR